MDGIPLEISYRQAFLDEYGRWCRLQISDQARKGFSDVHWIGDDYVDEVLSFGSTLSGVALPAFLEALVERRFAIMQAAAGVDATRSEASVAWPAFEAHMKSWARSKLAGVIDVAAETRSRRIRRNKGREVMTHLRRIVRQAGADWQPQTRDVAIVESSVAENLYVRTFHEVNASGFSYWHAIGFGGEKIPAFRESFLSWFGIKSETVFSRFDRHAPDDVAAFVFTRSSELLQWMASMPPPAR